MWVEEETEKRKQYGIRKWMEKKIKKRKQGKMYNRPNPTDQHAIFVQ